MPGHDEDDVRKAREQDPDADTRALDDSGMGGTGRTGDVGAGGAAGIGGVGGVAGTGMTDAEHGGSQDRLTPGIGAAGDQTDEELLEDR